MRLPWPATDRRIEAVVRHCTPETAQQVADKDYALVARGADRVKNFIHYAPPRALFEPRRMALYEEIRQAQAQATMKGVTDKGLYG